MSEKPKLSNKKQPTMILDTDTNEVLAQANLTPAATKRFMKHYTALGFNVRSVLFDVVKIA